jgi:hypothetical protein
MPQRVAGRPLGYSGCAHGALHRTLHHGLVQMMAPHDVLPGIEAALARREDVLPVPLSSRVRILCRERIRKPYGTVPGVQIARMNAFGFCELPLKGLVKSLRQHGAAIFTTFAVPNHDLAPGEIQILHTQPQTLEQPHATAVKKARGEPWDAVQLFEHGGTSSRLNTTGRRAGRFDRWILSIHGNSTLSTCRYRKSNAAKA